MDLGLLLHLLLPDVLVACEVVPAALGGGGSKEWRPVQSISCWLMEVVGDSAIDGGIGVRLGQKKSDFNFGLGLGKLVTHY